MDGKEGCEEWEEASCGLEKGQKAKSYKNTSRKKDSKGSDFK